MIRVYDDCGNVVDLVELGRQIREDVIKKLPESLYVDGFNDGYTKGKADGRKEAILYVRKLIKIFWKDWNNTSHRNKQMRAMVEILCNGIRSRTMAIRIKRYYCPKCEQFKNSFQVTNVEAWDFDNCKCCGTKCIDVESVIGKAQYIVAPFSNVKFLY